jgi:hypothetical protein
MITLTTKLCTLSRGELLHLNNSLLKVCEKIMGKKKEIKVRTTTRGTKYFGKYMTDTRTIFMYRNVCDTVGKYVEVFIHEYRHAKQKGIGKHYQTMTLLHGYWNNPYEVDARKAQKELRPEVWKEVKKLYKQKYNVHVLGSVVKG